MKNFLLTIAALATAAATAATIATALVATEAEAGEKYLGAIVSSDGSERSNETTSTPFKIAAGSKLTINCTLAANICTDTLTACTALGGANPGIPVAANANFPTSTAADGAVKAPLATAALNGAVVRAVGAAAFTCYVFARQGNE